MIKKVGYILLALLIVFGIYAWFASTSDYYDVFSNCHIYIKGDILKGNEDTVRKALATIKRTSPSNYALVCRNITKIHENTCLNSDPHFGYPENIPDGCYIKGSKTVYLKPVEDDNASVISARAQALVKLAEYSHSFWND